MVDLNTIRRILLQHWDPIGIGDAPDAADEYDRYAVEIMQLVQTGADRRRLEMYLSDVMTNRMAMQMTQAWRDRTSQAADLISKC